MAGFKEEPIIPPKLNNKNLLIFYSHVIDDNNIPRECVISQIWFVYRGLLFQFPLANDDVVTRLEMKHLLLVF